MGNKLSKQTASRVISLYKKGNSFTDISKKVGYNRTTAFRVVKKAGVKTRGFGEYKRTTTHRNIDRRTMIATINNMKSKGTYISHQRKAGKIRGQQLKKDIPHQRMAAKIRGRQIHLAALRRKK